MRNAWHLLDATTRRVIATGPLDRMQELAVLIAACGIAVDYRKEERLRLLA